MSNLLRGRLLECGGIRGSRSLTRSISRTRDHSQPRADVKQTNLSTTPHTPSDVHSTHDTLHTNTVNSVLGPSLRYMTHNTISSRNSSLNGLIIPPSFYNSYQNRLFSAKPHNLHLKTPNAHISTNTITTRQITTRQISQFSTLFRLQRRNHRNSTPLTSHDRNHTNYSTHRHFDPPSKRGQNSCPTPSFRRIFRTSSQQLYRIHVTPLTSQKIYKNFRISSFINTMTQLPQPHPFLSIKPSQLTYSQRFSMHTTARDKFRALHSAINNAYLLNFSKSSKKGPYTLATRGYRRRYFRDPAQSHNYAGLAQGFGYATRLEEKFQPGSTHIVSGIPVFEHHEYREPILLRYRFVLIRIFRRLTDRPGKTFFWTSVFLFFGYYCILMATAWDLATQTRGTAKEYMALAGLAMQARQLRLLIIEDLIEFQNEEAKHAFIGVLDGIEEELRREFNENLILRNLEYSVRFAFIQPLNEMLKPRKQKVFFEYASLQSYSRAVDNIHNRKAVTLEEQSLYRITNQHRERYWEHKRSTRSSWAKKRMFNKYRKRKRRRRFKHRSFLRTRHQHEPHNWGPLIRSFDNLPAYFFWGALVGLCDAFWLRDTNHPIYGPIPGKLFAIQPVHSNPAETEIHTGWSHPSWRRYLGSSEALEQFWGDGKMWFTQDRTFEVATNRIRDANSLLREMERYVVQGDYIKLAKDRIEDPADPLMRAIPDIVLNSSDKTMSGPLFRWYTRKLQSEDVESWALYRRFIVSEFLLLKKLHDWMRGAVFIQLGKQVPSANIQGYLKFYDESYLPYPDHKREKGDLDFKLGDEGAWDEVLQYAHHVQNRINDEAKDAWVKVGHSLDTFEPSYRIVESIMAVMPRRGNRATHTPQELEYWDAVRFNPWDTEFYRGKAHKAQQYGGDFDDPYLQANFGKHLGDPGTTHPSQGLAGARPKETSGSPFQGSRWDDLVLREMQAAHNPVQQLLSSNPASGNRILTSQGIQDPSYGRPIPRAVPDYQFTPHESSLPWPPGFFTDNPPLDDPYYYTRKYGLGTRKDWDRMVRMGAWEDVEHIEDEIATTTGHIPKIWDPDQIHSHNLPLFLHERTYKKLKNKAQQDPNSWNTTELLWLNVVQDKLIRARRNSTFALFPAPHERLEMNKNDHGTAFAIDCEATSDLFTSNQYNADWLLLSTLPSIYPIPPPLHELNFITTLVSRIEGCIMQHAAELDLSALKIRELMVEHAEMETRGLLTPSISPELQYDDEMQAILNHRPSSNMITRLSNSENIQQSTAVGNYNEFGERIGYPDRRDPYSYLGPAWTNRQIIVNNLRDGIDYVLDTLTGRGMFWDPDYQKRNRLKMRIRQSLNHSGMRVADALDAAPTMKFYFNVSTNGLSPTQFIEIHRNGGYGSSNPANVPRSYLMKMTAQEWIHQTRNEELLEIIVNHHYRKRLSEFTYANRLASWADDDWNAFVAAESGKQMTEFLGNDHKTKKAYLKSMQVRNPIRLLWRQAMQNKYLYARKRDPFDRTKPWWMYTATNADPQHTARNPHTGKHITFNRFAARILKETDLDRIIHGDTAKHLPLHEEKPLMKMRKELFLEQYGKGGHESFFENTTPAQREAFGNNWQAWASARTKAIKEQVENTITLDNVDQYTRLRNTLTRVMGGADPSAAYDLFNPDNFNKQAGIPTHHDKQGWKRFAADPTKVGGYIDVVPSLYQIYFPQ